MKLEALYQGFGDDGGGGGVAASAVSSAVRVPDGDGASEQEHEKPMWDQLLGFDNTTARYCDIAGPPGHPHREAELSAEREVTSYKALAVFNASAAASFDDAALQSYLLGQAAEQGVADRLFKCRFRDRYAVFLTDIVEYIERDGGCVKPDKRAREEWATLRKR